jgi:hypothetical protein
MEKQDPSPLTFSKTWVLGPRVSARTVGFPSLNARTETWAEEGKSLDLKGSDHMAGSS